jgi:hypothetical protein
MTMNLEIHKAAHKGDLRVEITEVFPPHYSESQRREIMEDEGRVLYEHLREYLPADTKAAMLHWIKNGTWA